MTDQGPTHRYRAIRPGTPVIITDASGEEHEAIAASSPKRGRDFVIVDVQLTTKGESIPWPAESVRASDRGAAE